jgi:large subunit ribosomal protein L4
VINVAKLSIYDIKGKAGGEVSVDTIPEGFQPNKVLIARSLRRQFTNARIPCAHSKTRAEVSGGGKKPWKQKGTGRARQGSTRAVQWRHGGVAFGPRPERNWTIGMNKKERKAALKHCVWMKIQDGEWILFSDFGIKEPSTKIGKGFLDALGREGKILVLLPADGKYEVVRKSLRNLPNVTIRVPERINTFDLLNNATVVAHEKAFETIRAIWQV